jgi:subtilisin family serine protease
VASRLSFVVALAGVVALNACVDAPTQQAPASAPSLKRSAAERTGDFMILGVGGALPADIDARVEAAGGTIVSSYPELGIAVARESTSGFAARAASIAGVESVTEDRMFELLDPNMRVVDFDGVEGDLTEEVASTADNDQLYFLQWAPAAINAPEAWNAGYRGEGVRVAILDGGLFNLHPDLNGNVDVARSRSYATKPAVGPGGTTIQVPTVFNEDVGTFWHGTHVAGIVAARDNTTGVVGIAPNATLIGVKVLHNGVGSFNWLIQGVLYASTPISEGGAGAQVVNMSLGALIVDGKAMEDKKDIKELTKALDRVMKYAWSRGVTVIAATGNDTTNLDVEKTAISIPAQSQHVISVAATGPLGWGHGNRDFARLASYSNWGKAVVDLAAPGGDTAWPTNELCTVGFVTTNCWVFDMYLSTSRAGWSWASGTSMAAPVTAGVAALIIQKAQMAGVTLSPAEVEAELRRGALDLGKPGNDAVYGHGWVNAYNSVR